MNLIRSKYRNRRSVSYLSWKANNDHLLELYKLLKENAVALHDLTSYVDHTITYIDNKAYAFKKPESLNHSFLSTIYSKLSDYSNPQRQFLTSIFDEAQDIWYKNADDKYRVNFQIDHLLPQEAPKDICASYDLDHLFSNTYVTLPPFTPKVEPILEEQQREYLIIVKDILKREKDALDKKLSGNRSRVFISVTLDLRDRIRILLRSLHIPTNDGKKEDSVHIASNNRCNNYFLILNELGNGQKCQYKSSARICYC